MQSLLAVDLGLRTGLALYGEDGRLIWYRSQHFGSTARFRRGVHGLLNKIEGIAALVLEGGGNLAEVWEAEATDRGILVYRVSAETWRREFLYPREQRSGPQAKRNAGLFACRVIRWSEAPLPTSLRHDTAEAILIGLWGVLHLGWLAGLPEPLRR